MLRVTVTRESASESCPIAEMVIGKFAGSDMRAAYVAHVYEPPSPYSGGVDAYFAVRGHERYQPALALVASALAAWREEGTQDVGERIRAALRNTTERSAARLRAAARTAATPGEDVTGQPLAPASSEIGVRPGAIDAPAGTGEGSPMPHSLGGAVAALEAAVDRDGGSDEVLRAALVLLQRRTDPAMDALAKAILAVAGS